MTSMRYKVLVVDDDRDGRMMFKTALQGEGFSVISAGSARESLLAAADSRPDLILADVTMPDGDGLTLCKRLKTDRRTARIPVILMSGFRKDELQQTEGIELGADDYLAKPFSTALMIAKVRAVLRRVAASAAPQGEVVKVDGHVIDLEARTATYKGRRLSLTRKEFDLLTTFLRKPGRVLSVPYLLETVWGYDPADYNDPHTVGVHVSSLRKKLGRLLSHRIVNVSGLGYRFDG